MTVSRARRPIIVRRTAAFPPAAAFAVAIWSDRDRPAQRIRRGDLQPLEGFRFVLLHQAAVTDDISGENGGEDPLPTAAGSSKLMGDGLLGEFASVVDAVERAVDIQRGMAERNSTSPTTRASTLTSGGPRSIPS
jgi:hypothetical protein